MAVNILKMSIFVIVSLAFPELRSLVTPIVVSSKIFHLVAGLAEVRGSNIHVFLVKSNTLH